MQALGCEAMLTTDASKAENPTKPDFKSIVQKENNLAIVPLSLFEDTDTGQAAAQKQSQLETLEKRFATLQIPVIFRSFGRRNDPAGKSRVGQGLRSPLRRGESRRSGVDSHAGGSLLGQPCR